MDFTSLAADPFSILTIVVAPAVLTNASSVLALGTTGRLARVADRTHAASALIAKMEPGASNSALVATELTTLETRAHLLLLAVRFFFIGLGLFASSALIAIAGSIAVYFSEPAVFRIAAAIGVLFGASAVISLVCGCVLMIRETQLAVESLAREAKAHLS